jgi:HAD superfamily hydrolase (TIGR01450 family)
MKQLQQIKHLALDLDGTLYLGGRLFNCTLPFLEQIKQLGIGRTFFTNNSSRSTRQYVEHLNHLGIAAGADDIYSSTHATLDYLRQQMPEVKRLHVMGTPALLEEFKENGFEVTVDEPDAVVVGYDDSLNYEKACRAAWWISQGKPFLATNPDRVCPTDKPTVLVDCGSICQMLTHATGIAPHAVLGKPNPQMLRGLMQRHQVTANQLAVVGDRVYTDIAMAHAAGAMGILVLSGEATRAVAEAAHPPPDLIFENVGELAELLSRR